MKLVLNDWNDSSLDEKQEFPGDTYVKYVSEFGVEFRISPSENGLGLSISVRRPAGFDQLTIHPKFSNTIEIH